MLSSKKSRMMAPPGSSDDMRGPSGRTRSSVFPSTRRAPTVIGLHQHAAGDEQRGGAHGIRVEIPIPDAERAARLVAEHLWVHCKADEDRAAERHREQEQSLVGEAGVKPGERRSFQGPADCDPVALQLQWDRKSDEAERGASNEGEPGHFSRRARHTAALEPNEAGENEGEERGLDDGECPNDGGVSPSVDARACLKEVQHARENRGEIWRASISGTPAQNERVGNEGEVERRRERELGRPQCGGGVLAHPEKACASRGQDSEYSQPLESREVERGEA